MGKSKFWTMQRILMLRRLNEAGKSRRDIALALGCSRDAVIGKAWRLGLSVDPDVVREIQSASQTKAWADPFTRARMISARWDGRRATA